MREKTNNSPSQDDRIAGRLDAIIALLAPLMRAVVDSESLIESAEEKAVRALNEAGVPQLQIAKLVGVSNNRVNALLKVTKKEPKTPAPEAEA